jgi:hypothetical protein
MELLRSLDQRWRSFRHGKAADDADASQVCFQQVLPDCSLAHAALAVRELDVRRTPGQQRHACSGSGSQLSSNALQGIPSYQLTLSSLSELRCALVCPVELPPSSACFSRQLASTVGCCRSHNIAIHTRHLHVSLLPLQGQQQQQLQQGSLPPTPTSAEAAAAAAAAAAVQHTWPAHDLQRSSYDQAGSSRSTSRASSPTDGYRAPPRAVVHAVAGYDVCDSAGSSDISRITPLRIQVCCKLLTGISMLSSC